ncbi:MAG: NAD(+) diphosphatase [Burkholderiaceae bacterium]
MPPEFEADRLIELTDDVFVHVFTRDKLILPHGAAGPLTWPLYQQAGFVAETVHGIGRLGGSPHVAVSIGESGAELPEGFAAANLRQLFGAIDDTQLAVAMRAVQVLEWDRTHRFCGACGRPTEHVGHERARECRPCRLTFYPRISPAMMVLIRDGNRLLLGRGINFPPGRFSALAGFLEAGETIEQAIHREVLEEVNVRIKNLRYFGSQSWPFPNSLMIAFVADYAGGELRADPAELAEAAFFEIDDLPRLPPPLSIARALIDATIAEIRDPGAEPLRIRTW